MPLNFAILSFAIHSVSRKHVPNFFLGGGHVQFVRTVSSYISEGPVLVTLMTRVRWNKYMTISSTSNVYLSTAGEWSKMLANENITASGPPKTFEPGRETEFLHIFNRSFYNIEYWCFILKFEHFLFIIIVKKNCNCRLLDWLFDTS